VHYVPPDATQPLDVRVVGLLKTALLYQLAELISMGNWLQKIEWMEGYIPARKKALSV